MIILSGKSGVSGTQFPLIEKIKSVQTVEKGRLLFEVEEKRKKRKRKKKEEIDTTRKMLRN